jgi:DNA-binding beta-propeller fold protein YncE
MGQVVAINASSNTVPSSGGCITVGNSPTLVAAAGDGSRVYVPHQGQTPNLGGVAIPQGVTVINPTTNQVVIDLGAPFTNPACSTDGAGCFRMVPVFIVSQ